MVYVMLADGFEEVEALAPVDMLRRAGVNVMTVGVTGEAVRGSHGIVVAADITAQEMDMAGAEMLVLPGGMPGTLNLEKSEYVQAALEYCWENGIHCSGGAGLTVDSACFLRIYVHGFYVTIFMIFLFKEEFN